MRKGSSPPTSKPTTKQKSKLRSFKATATLNDLDWDDLRVLCALFRERGARTAAVRLELDRATVVRRLARAEQVLGQRLFLRTRDGLRPSPAGTALWARLKHVEEAVAGLIVNAADDEIAGVVTVATTDGLAPWLLEQGLLEALAPWPALSITLVTGNAAVAVDAAEADVAVRAGIITGDGLLVRRAARCVLVAFCSAAYIAARGRPESMADLAFHDLLVPDGDLARLPEARLLRGSGGRVRFASSSLPALELACARGLGVTVLTQAWGTRAGLTPLFTIDLPPRTVSLVLNAESRERPAVRVVIDVLLRLLGRLDDQG